MTNDKNTKNKTYLKLRDLRKEKGLTIASLTEKTGIDHQKIGRVERGETPITLLLLEKIATVLHIPVQNLLKNNTSNNTSNLTNDNIIENKILDLITEIYSQFEALFAKHNISIDNGHSAAGIIKI